MAMIYVASLEQVNDTIIQGRRCITSIQELYRALAHRDTTGIVIEKDFAEAFFTQSGLHAFVTNACDVNPRCDITVKADVQDFKVKAVNALSKVTSTDELVYQLQARPAEMLGVIHTLCANYNNTYSETLAANNKVASLQLQNAELLQRLEEADDKHSQLLHDRMTLEAKLSTLVGRINYSYEKQLDPEHFITISGKSQYTRILYIKEVTRVRFIDTLVYYIKEILKTLYGVPAREVVIAPYYAYGGACMYPTLQPSFDLSYAQLYSSDIYMPGLQPNVMADILQNPSNIEYLIILDRAGFDTPHVAGKDVEYVYTMSALKDNIDNVPEGRIISYSGDSLHIPYIKGFDELSMEDKMVRYSSFEVVKYLIGLLERR